MTAPDSNGMEDKIVFEDHLAMTNDYQRACRDGSVYNDGKSTLGKLMEYLSFTGNPAP